jgi:sterol desaturase/sphingolipid hydroxylase (fatty acid hydroxylase superfamily)
MAANATGAWRAANATGAWTAGAWTLDDALALWGFSDATPLVLSLPYSLCILCATTVIPYFAVAAVCHWMDTAGDGKRFRQHKIQQDAPPLTAEERREAWAVAAFNMIVLNSVVGSIFAYPIWLARDPRATPNWLELPLHLAVYLVLTDLWFYAFHRWMHTRALYGRYHKQHHRFKVRQRHATTGATYAGVGTRNGG